MSTPRLSGKVALITGAAGGIGAAAARAMANEGAMLLLTDANGARVAGVAQELGDVALSRAHDVSSEQQWQEVSAWALDAHGRVDVLVNNAGVFLAAPLADTSLEDFRRVVDINLSGVFLGMRTFAPTMCERRAGSIVNVSSVAGLMAVLCCPRTPPPSGASVASPRWQPRSSPASAFASTPSTLGRSTPT